VGHRPSDEGRAAHMRSYQSHAPTCLVVSETLPLVSEDPEQRRSRRRFLESHAYVVN
jgi:hypothetical protein